jgi:hypothetical protein
MLGTARPAEGLPFCPETHLLAGSFHAAAGLDHCCSRVTALCLACCCCLCRYRHTSYQKQTKNQWARDDPAFVVVCCLLLAGASAAYCVT